MKRNLAKEALLSLKMLWKLFRYKDGQLFWIADGPGRSLGIRPAGCLNKSTGYWHIVINRKSYKRSRLVFFMHKGFWPPMIDHLNRIRHDDRIENLVASNASKNKTNTTSKGSVPNWLYISEHKCKGCNQGFRYSFQIREKGKIKTIKETINLNKLLAFRNKYLKEHRPDLWEICQRHGC